MADKRRYRPPNGTHRTLTDGDIAAFWSNMSVPMNFGDECWEWTGPRDEHGYGKWGPGKTRFGTTGAHRCAYTLFVGPITPGLHIDHLCVNTSCVRPDHLEPVTFEENRRRRDANFARKTGGKKGIERTDKAPKERYKCGHPATASNTLTYYHNVNDATYGICRQCKYDGKRRRKPDPANLLGKPFSPREQQVYDLICAGHRNKDIAKQLGIGLGGVEGHAQRIRAKLGTPRDETLGNRPAHKRSSQMLVSKESTL